MYTSKDIPGTGIIGEDLVKVILQDPVKTEDVIFEPRYCTFSKFMEPFLEKISNFPVREDDLWIASVPKSGTTWAQEMCWLIRNNFDFQKAKSVDTGIRCPCFELSGLFPSDFDSLKAIDVMESPRIIQTHLPLPYLPKEIWSKNPKIVYIARDPRDTALSMYQNVKNWMRIAVTKDEFFEYFMNSRIGYLPFFDHVFEYWKIRNRSNVLFLTYEEMKADMKGVILKTCKFFNKSITDENLTKMLDHLSFESMRNNKACSREYQRQIVCEENSDNSYRFIRRGIVGSHKDELSPELISILNIWMEKNLKNTDCNLFKI